LPASSSKSCFSTDASDADRALYGQLESSADVVMATVSSRSSPIAELSHVIGPHTARIKHVRDFIGCSSL